MLFTCKQGVLSTRGPARWIRRQPARPPPWPKLGHLASNRPMAAMGYKIPNVFKTLKSPVALASCQGTEILQTANKGKTRKEQTSRVPWFPAGAAWLQDKAA